MTREQQLRRAAIVCCACLRNVAYFRAGWREGEPVFSLKSNFQRTLNGNFLDVAVLEWRKLSHRNEKHSWKRIVTDVTSFESTLLTRLNLNQMSFEDYQTSVWEYRDKFVAHLDLEDRMNFPKLDIIADAVKFYYEYMIYEEPNAGLVAYGPLLMDDYFDACYREAVAFYDVMRVDTEAVIT